MKLNALFRNIKKGTREPFSRELNRNAEFLKNVHQPNTERLNNKECFFSFVRKEDIDLILFAEFPTEQILQEGDDEKKKKEIEEHNNGRENLLAGLKSFGYGEGSASDTKIKAFIRKGHRWRIGKFWSCTGSNAKFFHKRVKV